MKTHEHEVVPGSGTVIPDPERFDTVKRVWTTVLGGEWNLSQLWRTARYDWGLTSRPTRGQLTHPISIANFYTLLRNPFYAGKIRHGDKLYKGEHPPMVTWEDFQKVQAIFEKKAQKKHVALREHHHEFLYHGLVQCGACGNACVGELHVKPSGLRFVYYRCSRRRMDRVRCLAPAINEEDLTTAVGALLDTVTIDPQLREWAYGAIAWWAGDEPTPEKTVTRAKYSLKAAETALETATSLAIHGHITVAEYTVRRGNLLKKIEHFREGLAAPLERLSAWRLLRDEKKRNGLKLGDDFRNGDQAIKRKIVTRTIASITLFKRKPSIELRSPFAVRASSTNLQDGVIKIEQVPQTQSLQIPGST